jgi:hypothetical protein
VTVCRPCRRRRALPFFPEEEEEEEEKQEKQEEEKHEEEEARCPYQAGNIRLIRDWCRYLTRDDKSSTVPDACTSKLEPNRTEPRIVRLRAHTCSTMPQDGVLYVSARAMYTL